MTTPLLTEETLEELLEARAETQQKWRNLNADLLLMDDQLATHMRAAGVTRLEMGEKVFTLIKNPNPLGLDEIEEITRRKKAAA